MLDLSHVRCQFAFELEVTSGARIDLEGGIDVERAATQLDLSASSPTGFHVLKQYKVFEGVVI
jgi:hypothetical protein